MQRSTRNTDPETAFFPVEIIDMHCEPSWLRKQLKIPSHKAVIDKERNQVLSVVSNQYKLISNQEAFDAGVSAFSQIFSRTPNTRRNMEVFNVRMNLKRTTCIIDLVHNSVQFDKILQDSWRPMLRIINSYNRQLALQFDIGFIRMICENGVIFKAAVITYKQAHIKSTIGKGISIPASLGPIEQIMKDFQSTLTQLALINIDNELVIPLIAKATGISFYEILSTDEKKRNAALGRRDWFNSLAIKFASDYQNTSGKHTAQSILHAASDFASHANEFEKRCTISPHTLERSVGNWCKEFLALEDHSQYAIASYLEPLLNQLSLH